jgi:hypothetical protein
MSVFVVVAAAIAAAFISYRTIEGYRTGVLRLRETFDRRTHPRMYRLMLILVTILTLVSWFAVAVLIYGETHPEWRHPRRGTHHADAVTTVSGIRRLVVRF